MTLIFSQVTPAGHISQYFQGMALAQISVSLQYSYNVNYHVILKQVLRHGPSTLAEHISEIYHVGISKASLLEPQAADLNLRFKILSEFAFAHPVPLIYPRWFGDSTPDLFNVNGEILSVLDESICILSLGIGKCQRPCGNLA